jgi:hypothetical protein
MVAGQAPVADQKGGGSHGTDSAPDEISLGFCDHEARGSAGRLTVRAAIVTAKPQGGYGV